MSNPSLQKKIILGTAGHIDHGKTAFIRALTGIECDRLQEEKERGITIVLGYAHMMLPSGIKVGIVDVPGHEKFVSRMVAGAAGIDIVAFLIACDEGIKPQTIEHLHICEILGIKKGIIVLSKKDLADDELILLQKEEIQKMIAGTFLEDAPMIPVSALTGVGLNEFIVILDRMVAAIETKSQDKPFRMPVDASVTITGFGTIARGTVLSGHIAAGEEVVLLPGMKKDRIRGLQNHGHPTEEGFAGERLAINMPSLKKEEVNSGMVIARPDTFSVSDCFLVSFRYLPYNKKPLKRLYHGQCHVLTARVDAEMELLSTEKLLPGDQAIAVIKTAHPVAIAYGDYFVIRGYGLFTTMGGGRILHPFFSSAYREKLTTTYLQTITSGTLQELIELFIRDKDKNGMTMQALCGVLNEAEWIIDENLTMLKKCKTIYEDDQRRFYHRDAVQAAGKQLSDLVSDYHKIYPLRPGIGKEELYGKMSVNQSFFELVLSVFIHEDKQLEIANGLVKKTQFNVTNQTGKDTVTHRLEKLFMESEFMPPAPAEAAQSLQIDSNTLTEALNLLTRSNRLIRISEEYYLHVQQKERLYAGLKLFFEKNELLKPADLKTLFGIPRKYSIPLLVYLDGIKFTVRTPEGRKLFLGERTRFVN